ncbi:MAG: hypothetical protein LBG46_03470 [Elusimicrobiota bacterium]|jgi:glycerol kinase|nr:hypothetical protein [Elusimicrobiota bacterium]
MKNKIIIALDQGSSSSRAAAVNGSGVVIHKESIPVNFNVNGVKCECDARDILKSQLQSLDKTIAALPENSEIISIAVCAQRSTIVLWDKITGSALCPALSWLDGRAAAQAELNPMTQEEIHSRSGLYKTPYYSAPKIKWCLQNYSDVKQAARKGRLMAGPVATWLIWNMTKGKVFATDITNAQRTLLFNIKTMSWDDEILKSFDIPKNILPQVISSAADFGFYKNIPITVCVGDQQAACAATGLLKKGDCAINYGTGAFVLLNIGANYADIAGILTSVSYNSQNRQADFILEGPINTAASLFTWLQTIGLDFDIQDMDKIYANSKEPAQIFPALGGIGAPIWNFKLTPVIYGLKPNTTKNDIIAGALRGLAFLTADIINYISKSGFNTYRVQASGGLSASGALLKFQSDILQCPIIRAKETESGALGAAYIAAENLNMDTSKWETFKNYEVFEPSVSQREAAAKHSNWRQFADWALKQPL